MSKKHKFRVTLTQVVTVEFNASIMPDDEWRKQFYGSIRTPSDLAEHIAYNYAANGIERLSELDGFADKKDSLCTVDGRPPEIDECEAVIPVKVNRK